jgi:adenylate cyclase
MSFISTADRMAASENALDVRVMMVDDDPLITDMLTIYLRDAGYTDLITTNDSSRAMDLMGVAAPDLLITDLRMPEIDGFELLRQVRNDSRLSHIPVIMLTSSSDSQSKLEALELGATDFLAKPVDPSELVLRLRNNLAVKAYQDQLQLAQQESDRLLLSILPAPVAERLKRGETNVADYFDSATVLFADLVGFTNFASKTDANTVVQQLNEVFQAFDQIVESRGLEKIKTIGDSYMLAGGLPRPMTNHARTVVDAGLAMLSLAGRMASQGHAVSQVRIGVHTGPLVAGVIGTSKFYYDLWGDTVNVASRMESSGVTGRLQISNETRLAINNEFEVEARGPVDIKGKGLMETYFVLGHKR